MALPPVSLRMDEHTRPHVHAHSISTEGGRVPASCAWEAPAAVFAVMFIDRCGPRRPPLGAMHGRISSTIRSTAMLKHLVIVILIVAAVGVSAYVQHRPTGPDAEFRCRLPDIACDACRGSVISELKEEPGIRAVRFEGEDRKELVVTHSASRTPETLRASLARIGYPAEAIAGDASKALSHAKCVCPSEQAAAAKP